MEQQGARLAAHDAERERLATILGCETFESQFDFDKRCYGYAGRDIAEALRASPHADWFATAAYLEQVISEDIVYAYVPMLRLAAQIGVELPVTRGMVDVMGAMLGRVRGGCDVRLPPAFPDVRPAVRPGGSSCPAAGADAPGDGGNLSAGL